MKKIAMLVIGIAFLSACKKDYTCECITNPGNTIKTTTIKSATKRQAKANCFSYSYTYNDPFSGTSVKVDVNCTLK
jgi:hypothetical protein